MQLMCTFAEERKLRITEIEAILENNLFADKIEEAELMAEKKELELQIQGVTGMTCNYMEYRELMEKIFCGSVITESRMNEATELIRQYLVNGGAGNVLAALKIGINVVTRKAVLLPSEVTHRRFVWLDGERKGKELDTTEIEAIGMFLKHGAFYGKCGVSVI